MSQALQTNVFQLLDLLVFVRIERGEFELVGEVPPWLQTLKPDHGFSPGANACPQTQFEYLNHFLEDAENLWKSGQAGMEKSMTWVECTPEGDDCYLEAIALLGEDGGQSLLIQVKQRQAEEKQRVLQRARENLLSAHASRKDSEKKEVLLHCIVHDLKSPLAGISSSLDLLSDHGSLTEQQDKLVELCNRQSQKLERLIGNILEAFSAEIHGFGSFVGDSRQAPDIHRTALDVVSLFQSLYKSRRVQLELDSELHRKRKGRRVIAEQERLERVLGNLLENALRYSPKRSTVVLKILRRETHVRVEVTDQGSGIPADKQDKLFDKFSSYGPSKGAIGLGLFICRMYVERWGGTIGCHNSDDIGACFWFELKQVPA